MNYRPPPQFSGQPVGVVRRCAVLFALLLLSACQAGPPVQEMSDARQAIAVAREAGAHEFAADKLSEAEHYLQRAEDSISRKSYAAARREALDAKRSALDALSMADRNSENDDQNEH